MQEQHLFEYAVIRVVPRVEREEFLNVGIILYCPKHEYLKMLYSLDHDRLRIFSSELDFQEIEGHLRAFQVIAEGGPESGPIGKLDRASRFRWLTATRSTVVQTSKVHPGLCDDPEKKINHLQGTLVLS